MLGELHASHHRALVPQAGANDSRNDRSALVQFVVEANWDLESYVQRITNATRRAQASEADTKPTRNSKHSSPF